MNWYTIKDIMAKTGFECELEIFAANQGNN